MVGMRFIGSKAHLLQFIEDAVLSHSRQSSSLGDVFCGTAVVSRHFKKLGYQVTANDNLTFCTILAKAILLNNEEPMFSSLMESNEVQYTNGSLSTNPYDRVISSLNQLAGEKSFMYTEYSPGGTRSKSFQRKYFTDKNAMKIDAVRSRIESWKRRGLLTEGEEALILSDLMKAANRVANIAGTYGYFMKEFDDSRVLKDLLLKRSTIVRSNEQHRVYQEDANQLVARLDCQILYLDPPYTWRHYGAYYHVLESIARWDNPKVEGLSGLRPWGESKSRYCYRDQAANALADLIENARAPHIFLSYNSEGLISHQQIIRILSSRGKPRVYEKEYRRYKSNSKSGQKQVKERLYYVNAN